MLSAPRRRPPPSGSACPWIPAGASRWAIRPAPSSRGSTTASGAALDLPHDWSIEGTPRRRRPRRRPRRLLPRGHRLVPQVVPAARPARGAESVWLEFDGVYMNSDVWINGVHLGRRPYGYISFAYDVTQAPGAGRERGRRAGGQLAPAQLPLVHRQRHLPPRLADHGRPAARGPLGHLRDDAARRLRRRGRAGPHPGGERPTDAAPGRAPLGRAGQRRARGRARGDAVLAGRRAEASSSSSGCRSPTPTALVGGDADAVHAPLGGQGWRAGRRRDHDAVRHPHASPTTRTAASC